MRASLENNLIAGNIGRAVGRLTFLFLLTYLLENLAVTASMIIIGRYGDAAALSAISVGARVIATALTLCFGFCTSLTAMIARQIGKAGDNAAMRVIIGNGAFCMLLLAAGLLCLLVFGSGAIITLMRVPPEAAADARGYLVICGLGIPFIAGYTYTFAIYNGFGDAKTPMLLMAAACSANIALAIVLVNYAGMRVAGVALAAALAHFICFSFSIFRLRRLRGGIMPSWNDLRPRRAVAGEMTKTGLPMIAYYLLRSASSLIVVAIINTGGLLASAAAGVTETIINFEFLIPVSVASAVMVVAAQNLGSGQAKRAAQATVRGMIFCVLCGALFCLFCQLMPQFFTGLVTRDALVSKTAAVYLQTYSIDCILAAAAACLNSYFIARGKTGICMAHMAAAAFLGRVPFSYIISRTPGATLWHMGFAAPVSSAISIAICLFFLCRLKKP
ncbi:MAG: MATE family efflux transporter [Oscillospiraceae bacterium]|nr:MATE family efflux transporter [Oscillospiraceae bacterium]